MWIQLTVDGQPELFNTDNMVTIREFRGKTGGTIIEAVTPDSYHADESYEDIKAMIGFANQVQAGIHRNPPNLVMNAG